LRGPRHKRYLLLTSEEKIDEPTRKGLSEVIAKRHPEVLRKAVWLERGLIVRTDNVEVDEVRAALEVGFGEVSLKSALTSGSIGKLKKATPK